MSRDFANQVVVITGASAGIGAALAEEVVRRGGRVVVAARRRELLEALASRVDGEVEVVVADATNRGQLTRVFEAAIARFGQVDVWVNNAGRGISREVAALTDEDVDTMIRDNLKSALYGIQTVLPYFRELGRGTIVNVSSQLARVSNVPQRSAYSAAKAALSSLTDSLRVEVAATHPQLRIVEVIPGVVATDFGNNAVGGGVDSRSIPGGQTAEEVARAITDGLRDGGLQIYTRPEGLEMTLGWVRESGTRVDK